MTYPYGTHGAPAVGGGLPGLPRRGSEQQNVDLLYLGFTRLRGPITTSDLSGVLDKLEGATHMRVALIGGGGFGTNTPGAYQGGGGGSCASTKMIPATLIEYTVGGRGRDSLAVFAGYELFAGAGTSLQGGTATGGDRNYPGGNPGVLSGSYSPGGGAAGPSGKGGDAATEEGVSGEPGEWGPDWWGPGGGGGGSFVSSRSASAGSGPGQEGGISIDAAFNLGSGFTFLSSALDNRLGTRAGLTASGNSGSLIAGLPGEPGGGGVGRNTSPAGAPGGLFVEWFAQRLP